MSLRRHLVVEGHSEKRRMIFPSGRSEDNQDSNTAAASLGDALAALHLHPAPDASYSKRLLQVGIGARLLVYLVWRFRRLATSLCLPQLTLCETVD